MPAAILYEVNTRVWLRELSEKEGRTVTLADIPESEITRWSQLGFTHIWLMGVWQVGPKAREIAVRLWREHWQQQIDSVEADVQGSPFAIEEYAVDSRLGDALSLLMLKERLGRAGLRLILDFVPNHLGIDSTEPVRFPARFVHSMDAQPGTFRAEARFGPRYFAHGRDPHFDPWIDTVQLDYRVIETHEAMRSVAQTVSVYGNGLRCDMAMLLLPEIFVETWKHFPSPAAHQTNKDFWRKTIAEVRQLQPQVELIAEVYWDREEQLQELGFDYTYNKRVCDYLVRRQDAELIQFLRSCSVGYLTRSVHFLENHDEARAASVFDLERHKLAAALILFLPGMALLHDGQLAGRKEFARIQMTKRANESGDAEIARFYEELLLKLQRTYVRRGKPSVMPLAEEATAFAVKWERGSEADVAIVNFGSESVKLQGAEVLYSTGEMPRVWEGMVEVPRRMACVVRSRIR
jgi:glycosidase